MSAKIRSFDQLSIAEQEVSLVLIFNLKQAKNFFLTLYTGLHLIVTIRKVLQEMNFTPQNLGDIHPRTEKSRTNKNKQTIKLNKNKIKRNEQCVQNKG